MLRLLPNFRSLHIKHYPLKEEKEIVDTMGCLGIVRVFADNVLWWESGSSAHKWPLGDFLLTYVFLDSLLVQWSLDETQDFYGPVQRAVIELNLLHKSLEATIAEGLAQTADYMDRVGTDEGYLIVFDRTPEVPWEERIFMMARKGMAKQYVAEQLQIWAPLRTTVSSSNLLMMLNF